MRRRLVTLSLFAAAMAYVEAAVVAYLRAIYYPAGFSFPLTGMPQDMLAIEVARELATLIMLAAVAMLSGADRWERFLHFALVFGVWDILYYAWLEVILGWPASLLEWDILFLIPVPWLGPVLVPLIVSASLIGGSLVLLSLKGRGTRLGFTRLSWTLVVLAGLVVVGTFTYDWRSVIERRPPSPYPWAVFLPALALALGVFLRSVRRLDARQ